MTLLRIVMTGTPYRCHHTFESCTYELWHF